MSQISLINPMNLGKITGVRSFASLDDLASLITKYKWAPGTFTDNKRSIDTFVETSLLVLDVDDGCTIEEALQHFSIYTRILATTKSHKKEKNGKVCDRFRVIIPLMGVVSSADHYRQIYDSFVQKYPFIDPACKDASRYFEPCVQVFYKCLGVDLPIPAYVEQVKREVPAASSITSKGRLTRKTMDFMVTGALPGYRHTAIVAASLDMKGQGWTEEEVIEELERITERSGIEHSDDHARKTVHDIFTKRQSKDEFREIPVPEISFEDPIYVPASDMFDEMFSYLNDKDLIKGDPTGLEGLDKMLGGGFRQGELTIMMASAKSGKNALYHFLMEGMLQRGLKIGYASRELNGATEVIPNLLTISLQKNLWKEKDLEQQRSVIKDTLSKWNLYFAGGYGYFPSDKFQEWVENMHRLGVTHIFYDHLHYAIEEEDPKLIARTIRDIKTVTKKYNMHVHLIVQPKQLMEGQQLGLYTLRGGAAIGQACDNLIIMERLKDSDNVARLKLECARHKLAKPGHIFVQYNAETTSFIEVEKELDPTPPVSPGFNQAKFQLQAIKYAE